MTTTPTPIYPQTLYNAVQTITAAETTTIKALTTTQTNGLKVESILVTSNDTSARDVCLYMTISSTNYLLIQVQIPITAGQVNTTPPVNLLAGGITPGSFPGLPVDGNGNPYIYLPAGATLSVNTPVALTSAKTMNIIATGASF